MSAGEYIVGATFFVVTIGGSALAGWIVLARLGGGLKGPPRFLGWGILASLFVFAAHLIPGALGILSRGTAALTAVVLLCIASAIGGLHHGSVRPPESEPRRFPIGRPAREERLSWLFGAGALVAVTTYVMAVLLEHADNALLHPDVITFHLPNVARWIDSGSLWQVDDFVPDRAPGNYPQSGDIFMLSTILPWSSDFLARFVALPFVALTGLGVYAAAREVDAPPPTAIIVSSAVLAMPVVGYLGTLGLADPEMLGLFAAGGYFLIRHWRTGNRFDLALAGIGLGLSFGTRWYAVYAVLAVLAVWATASLVTGRGRRETVRTLAVLGGLVGVCGGFWLLRNLVESGNPVFPVRVAPLGLVLFDAPADPVRDLLGQTLAGYADDPGIWRKFLWGPFLEFMTWTAVLLWLAAPIGLAIAMRARNAAGRGHVIALVACAAIIVAAYAVTPFSALGPEGQPGEAWVNSRYVVPALLALAPVAAWAIARSGRARPLVEAVLAIAILDALRRATGFPQGGASAEAVLVVVVAVTAVGAAAVALSGAWARRRPSWPALVTGVAVLSLVLLAAGRAYEHRFNELRYTGLGEPVDYIRVEAPSGSRIGLAGEGFGNYPYFGPRLGNEVVYIGSRVDGMLRAYARYRPFVEAVRRGRFDLVVVQDISTLDPTLPHRQQAWLRKVGFEPVAEGTHPTSTEVAVTLYRPPRDYSRSRR